MVVDDDGRQDVREFVGPDLKTYGSYVKGTIVAIHAQSARIFERRGVVKRVLDEKEMRHRIRRKLLKFERDVLPALKCNDWSKRWLPCVPLSITENCNGVTEFRNVGENENSPYGAPFAKKVVRGTGFEPANPYGTSPSSWHL